MYEETYGTDWETLDRDQAMSRAFALGVAASLGQHFPEEYDRIVAEMDTAYNESIVELAYEEGRTKAKKEQHGDDADDEAVWSDLVEGEKVTVDEDEVPSHGRDTVPSALDRSELLDRPHQNDMDRVERPDFLDR